MSMKLFALEEADEEVGIDTIPDSSQEETPDSEEVGSMTTDQLDAVFESLDQHTDAYTSLTNVHSAMVSNESFSLVDKNNYILFNEYMGVLSRNLGVNTTAMVATESVVDTPHLLKHHHLAIEGFISSLWEKIKAMFSRIGRAMSEFFKRHFTRLGKVKKRLENIVKTLEKSDKDIKTLHLEKIPGKLKTAFPNKGTLDEATLNDGLRNALQIKRTVEVINTEAKKVSRLNVMDRDFVAQIKALRDSAQSTRDSRQGGKIGAIKNHVPFTDNKAKTKQAKGLDKEADNIQDEMRGEVVKNAEVAAKADNDNDVGLEAAKKELEAFYAKVEVEMNKLVDKPLPGKTKITKVTVSPESGIDIETEKNDDEPDSCNMGSRATILNIAKKTLEIVKDMEVTSKTYDDVNKEINKIMGDVDKITKELSRSEEVMDKMYQNVLQSKVKARLNLLKDFFSSYNKLQKNLLNMTVEFGEGVVVYSTTSMKHFG